MSNGNVTRESFPASTSDADLDREIDLKLTAGALSCWVEQDGGQRVLACLWPAVGRRVSSDDDARTTRESFPASTADEALDREIDLKIGAGALTCWIDDGGQARVLVCKWPVAGGGATPETPAPGAGPAPRPVAAAPAATDRTTAGGAAGAAPATTPPPAPAGPTAPAVAGDGASDEASLGRLSERFESRGDPGAIGNDSTGGFSYGKYQIATRTGTMTSYLGFLRRRYPDLASTLDAAGGAPAAREGTDAFQLAWKGLAGDPQFAESQHAFIKATHYDPFVDRTNATTGLDFDARSLALRNVAWSTSVQHGPNSNVFVNAFSDVDDVNALDDAVIIERVYDERSDVDLYFSRSEPRVKAAVKRRFGDERALALRELAEERGLA